MQITALLIEVKRVVWQVFWNKSLIVIVSCLLLACQSSDKSKVNPVQEEVDSSPKGSSINQDYEGNVPEGMRYIPGATYVRGSEGRQDNGKFYQEESPKHPVKVSSFFMDATEVTNADFKAFVDATGYITFAEKGLSKEDFPLAPPEMLVAGASVFTKPNQEIDPHRYDAQLWWPFTKGASWKTPLGPESSIKAIMNHPVVCVNYNDAQAYAKWAGKRLPTEAEWELAARGGLTEKRYVWGDERKPDDKWQANAYQGSFPANNTAEDGFVGTAPVKSFAANGYGLYDMAGNVWEICADLYDPTYYADFSKNPVANPKGPEQGVTGAELAEWAQSGVLKTAPAYTNPLLLMRSARGGSFLCHVEYCLRYRPAARHYSEAITPTNHIGFRCVKDVE